MEYEKADKRRLKKILDNARNVAAILEADELGRIGNQVLSTYSDDINEETRLAKQDKWIEGQKIVKQVTEAKTTPFENAANVKYPMLTTACIQFNARSYPTVVKGNSVIRPQIVGGKFVKVPEPQEGMSPEEIAQIQAQAELQEKLKEKLKKAYRACEYMNWQIFNEMTEWEPDTDRLLLMLPLYGDMFRKIWYSESKRRLESKLLSPEHLVFPCNAPSIEDSPRISESFTLYPNQIQEKIRQEIFIEFPYDGTDDDPHEFIEQHCWYDLDYDNYKEPYIVTVHKQTGHVAQIMANFTMESVKQNKKGQVASIKPISHYVQYQFVPSSDGSIYGLGFFDILYPINEVINTTINQMLDAGTLANTSSGFIGKEAKIKRGNIRLKQGEFVPVPVRGDDIRKGIVHMNFPGPAPGLFQLLGLMIEAGKDVANIKDVLMGEQKPNQTATATLALIEQGTKVYSAIHKRIYRAMKNEFQMLRKWNSLILDQQRYADVMDMPVKKDDFDDASYDFVPMADPEGATDMQRMGRAEFLLTFRGDPYVNQAEIRRRVLDAANIEDSASLMQEPAESPEQLQEIIRQLQQKIQQLGGVQLKFKAKELELKERDMKLKEAKSPADIAAQKASALDRVASAEAREAGTQIEQYKAQAGVENDQRGRILDMEKIRGNAMGVGNSA